MVGAEGLEPSRLSASNPKSDETAVPLFPYIIWSSGRDSNPRGPTKARDYETRCFQPTHTPDERNSFGQFLLCGITRLRILALFLIAFPETPYLLPSSLKENCISSFCNTSLSGYFEFAILILHLRQTLLLFDDRISPHTLHLFLILICSTPCNFLCLEDAKTTRFSGLLFILLWSI